MGVGVDGTECQLDALPALGNTDRQAHDGMSEPSRQPAQRAEVRPGMRICAQEMNQICWARPCEVTEMDGWDAVRVQNEDWQWALMRGVRISPTRCHVGGLAPGGLGFWGSAGCQIENGRF